MLKSQMILNWFLSRVLYALKLLRWFCLFITFTTKELSLFRNIRKESIFWWNLTKYHLSINHRPHQSKRTFLLLKKYRVEKNSRKCYLSTERWRSQNRRDNIFMPHLLILTPINQILGCSQVNYQIMRMDKTTIMIMMLNLVWKRRWRTVEMWISRKHSKE